jgi:hypothetical protein
MALSTYDISAEQGTNYLTAITYTDDDGDPVNLTGYTARMQVRRFTGSPIPFITLTSSSGLTITAASGVIDMAITAAALSAIPAGSYKYDLEIVSGAGVVTKLLGGDFDLQAEVTR